MPEPGQLIVTLPDQSEISLKKYIELLKGQVKAAKNEKVEKSTSLSPKKCRLTAKQPVIKPHRTPEQEAEYQKRMKRLRNKIAELEYENMTKNINSKSAKKADLKNVLSQVKTASGLAYNHFIIALSVLTSILAFFFIPVYLLPERSFPLGLRVGIGFCLATIILLVEIFFYAKAFFGNETEKFGERKNLDYREVQKIYASGHQKKKLEADEKVSLWQKKTE